MFISKKQKMEFLLSGEFTVHLSKLASPPYLLELSEFLAQHGYIELFDAKQAKSVMRGDLISVQVLKKFQINIRTGGIVNKPKSRWKPKAVVRHGHETFIWEIVTRTWSNAIASITQGKNVGLHTTYESSPGKLIAESTPSTGSLPGRFYSST